jgi:hypothetical protein
MFASSIAKQVMNDPSAAIRLDDKFVYLASSPFSFFSFFLPIFLSHLHLLSSSLIFLSYLPLLLSPLPLLLSPLPLLHISTSSPHLLSPLPLHLALCFIPYTFNTDKHQQEIQTKSTWTTNTTLQAKTDLERVESVMRLKIGYKALLIEFCLKLNHR